MLRERLVVKSLAGRDKGELFAVAGIQKDRVLLYNGKDRKIEKPKAKNPKHIEETSFLLSEEQVKTNRILRKTLNKIANPGG